MYVANFFRSTYQNKMLRWVVRWYFKHQQKTQKRLQEAFRRSMELHATSHKFIQIDGTTTICVQQDAQRPDAVRVSNDACKFWKDV